MEDREVFFHDKSTKETTPIMFHVESAHRPDDVLGNVCVECLEAWPCPWWKQLRVTLLAILNIPFRDMQDIAAGIYREAAEEIRQVESRGETPISLQGVRARKK